MAYSGRRPFTDLEVRTVLDALNWEGKPISLREKAWFVYGIATGFRFKELSHLKIKAVSHKWKVHGHATVEAKYTKNGEGATQPVRGNFAGESPTKIMQDWLDHLQTIPGVRITNYVFIASHKNPPNKPISRAYANRRLTDICSSNGIYGPIGTHSLRKTFTLKMDTYRREQFRRGEISEDPNRLLMKDGRWKHMETMEHYRNFIYSEWDDIALDFSENQ
jgi:site-specific recombinase XerD